MIRCEIEKDCYRGHYRGVAQLTLVHGSTNIEDEVCWAKILLFFKLPFSIWLLFLCRMLGYRKVPNIMFFIDEYPLNQSAHLKQLKWHLLSKLAQLTSLSPRPIGGGGHKCFSCFQWKSLGMNIGAYQRVLPWADFGPLHAPWFFIFFIL